MLIGYTGRRMASDRTLKELNARTRQAVGHYWQTRTSQQRRQQQTVKADQGLRSAVTGGKQMDEFIGLFTDLITDAGKTLTNLSASH